MECDALTSTNQRALPRLNFTSGNRREYLSAAMLALSLFLLLGGYYLLKTVREVLILTEGGAEVKSYASAGQALILLFALPAFGWIANRTRGFRLVSCVYLFFIANLGIFYLLSRAGMHVAVEFYLWLGVFSVMTVALFWSFSNDVYDEEQGRRLFPYIGVGAPIGALLGAPLAKKLIHVVDVYGAMLGGAALLLAAISLLWAAQRFVGSVAEPRMREEASTPPIGGFRLIASHRYLALIALMVVMTNVVNTTGEFIVSKTVVTASKEYAANLQKSFIAGFYADYYTMIGVVGLLVQALAVAPIFRRFGAGGALLILPVVAMTGYAAMAALPVMWLVRAAKITENSLDYSLQNTAKHAMFLPTSAEMKYKAKATIDSFFYRFGDLLQAGLVLLGTWLSFSLADFARMNVVVSIIWFGVAFAAMREYRRKTSKVVEAPAGARLTWPQLRPRLASLAPSALAAKIVILGAIGAGVVYANEPVQTRAEEIEQARDVKTATLQPDQPGRLEKYMTRFKDEKMMGRFQGGFHGFAPVFGGMPNGSGLALGTRYLHEGANGRYTFDALASISTLGWTKVEAGMFFPKIQNGNWLVDLRGTRYDYKSLPYYGPGPDSEKTGRSNYRLEDLTFDALLGRRLSKNVLIGASGGFESARIRPGENDRFASATSLYPNSVGAFSESTDFIRSGAFVQIDTRNNGGDSKRGRLIQARFDDYRARSSRPYNFQRLDIEAQQYIPALNNRRVFVLRGRTIQSFTNGDHQVPFFHQAVLGGIDDLRGFRPYRFQDDNVIVMDAEYRWEVFSGLDMAVFGDAGRVSPNRWDFTFRDLETSAGFGFRFNAQNRTFLRLDVGFSHEGFQVYAKFNGVFRERRAGSSSPSHIF